MLQTIYCHCRIIPEGLHAQLSGLWIRILYIYSLLLFTIQLKVAVSVYNNGVKFLTSNNTQSAWLHYEHVLEL